MTVDLEQQIRDYASHVTELSTPVDVVALTLDARAEARRLPRYRRLEARWAAGLVAAVAILALIGGLALGYRLLAADEPPVITEPAPTPSTSLPAPTTSLPSPTTLVGPAAAPSMTWERVPPQVSLGAGDDDHEYLLQTVINGGPGLIAGGGVQATSSTVYYTGIPEPGDQAAVWTSEDGVVWERIPTEDSGLAGPGGYVILDLVVGGPGYVAVGGAMEDGHLRPAVWVSEDALGWTRVNSDSFDNNELTSVAASDEGVVAVGDGDIWFSPDGWAWQRVVSPPNAYFSGVDHADLGFVAVGYVEKPNEVVDGALAEAFRAVVAISQDGVNWVGVDLPEGDDSWFGARASSIVADGDEVVVAGSYRTKPGTYFDMHPAFWTSNDGSTWDRYGVPRVSIRGLGRPSAFVSSLVNTRSGVVAVGGWFQYGTGPPTSFNPPKTRAAVWTSSEPGGPWGEIPSTESLEIEMIERNIATTVGISGVAVIGDVLVGVSTDAGEAVVWIGEWTD